MNELNTNNFKSLRVWQESHFLVISIYKNTKHFPKEEIFGLSSQMRRAAVSVTSNIAESYGRRGNKEKIQFFFISLGSIHELDSQLLIARDINYISKEEYIILEGQIIKIIALLHAIIKSTKSM